MLLLTEILAQNKAPPPQWWANRFGNAAVQQTWRCSTSENERRRPLFAVTLPKLENTPCMSNALGAQ
jgi:hypothetical protein